MKKALGAILAAALLFRLLHLGTRQLWTEELIQALVARSSSVGEVFRWLQELPFSMPLDYLLQWGMVLILGDSNWVLRLPAALFGTLSILLIFRVSQFLFGPRVALYTAALFSFYPLQYHYSQEGRPYALFLLLSLVSFDLLLRQAAKKGASWRGWILFFLSLVLLLYTSPYAFTVIFCQLALLIVAFMADTHLTASTGAAENREELLDPPAVSWIHIVIYAAAAVTVYPWLNFACSKPLIALPRDILNARNILRILKELGDNSYLVTGFLLLAAFAGARALVRHGRRMSLFWLFAWFSYSFLGVLVLDVWSGNPLSIGQVLHATPPLILLAGYGLSYISERMTILDRLPYRLSSPAIAYLGILVIMCMVIAFNHWRREPVDWKGTATYLQQMLQPGDGATIPETSQLLGYYAPSLGNFRVDDLDPGPGTLSRGNVKRRVVVCYDGMAKDPCAGFRAPALKDHSWQRLQLRGFTIFVRKAP
jgi:hypothetical protein